MRIDICDNTFYSFACTLLTTLLIFITLSVRSCGMHEAEQKVIALKAGANPIDISITFDDISGENGAKAAIFAIRELERNKK